MSLKLKSIESVFRPVITAAFKSLESKTYDTTREDYMDILLEDLFQILFPKPKETEKKKPKSPTQPAVTTPTEEKKKPGPKPKTPPQSSEAEPKEKAKPGPKPKVDENGNRINSPRNRSPKPEEEKKKPGPKPKLDENGNPINPPRNRKKKEPTPVPPPPSPPKKENVPLPPSPVHIKKVDPTIRKKLKESAKKNKMEFEKEHETKFLEWVNNLSVEEFKANETEITDKYFESLTKATVPPPSPQNPPLPPTPTKQKEEESVESELTEAFGPKGESYWVDKQTGRVYEGEGEIDQETGAYANYKPLGYVGEGVFKNLKV
jgi:hypothetical protein